MLLLRNVWLVLCAIHLSGCVSLFPKPAKKDRFELQVVTKSSPFKRIDQPIHLAKPFADLSLNSRSIAVEIGSNPVKITIAKNQEWIVKLPDMLEQELALCLQNYGGFKNVVRDGQGMRPVYMLVCNINDFQIVYQDTQNPPSTLINMDLKIMSLPDKKIVATKSFRGIHAAAENKFFSILESFNQQNTKILHDITDWVRHHVANDKKP